VSNVDTDGARHAFIESLVRFSLRIGSRLIAEGIETEHELVTLAGLGVEAGQGYFIAAPATGEFPMPSANARRMIAAGAQRLRLGAAQVTAGEFISQVDGVDAGITVQEAYGRLLADPSLGTLVICDPDGRVTGQVPRRTLDRVLASPGAWDRYGDRPLVELAERHPLCVPAHQNITEVGAILAAREAHELTEDALVTDPHGRLIGVLPVREVLRALAEIRGNGEQALNPVSGLPSSEWAERELARQLEAGQPVSVIVADLDGFREINDAGGYAVGDDVIRSVARCLAGVAGGVDGAAVAHVGGDDFLLILPPGSHEDVVAEVIRRFETEVVPTARVELRLRGADAVAERLSLSMASVDLAGEPPAGHRHLEWARDLLAHLLVTAKGAAGHSLARQAGERSTVSTWTPRPVPDRRISVGLVEPDVVLRAVELIEESWNRAWSAGFVDEGLTFNRDAFPGPPGLVTRLQERYGDSLR
jgi:diguanylate cyclase (GGDEF)-like protein